MKYFKDSNGDVFAYDQSDLHMVATIEALEGILQSEQDQEAKDQAQAELEQIPQAFFGIRSRLETLTEMTEEEVEEHMSPSSSSDPGLPPLTASQMRLGLVTNGISLSQVEAAIAAIEDPQDKAVAEIEWEYASQFLRTHPLIEQIGAALGLTPEQIDAMWEAASEL